MSQECLPSLQRKLAPFATICDRVKLITMFQSNSYDKTLADTSIALADRWSSVAEVCDTIAVEFIDTCTLILS